MASSSNDDARRLAAAASDEDYFPAFLTATPSAPKASKTKASAPANTRAKRYADGGAFKAKPRLRMTFAESLAMDKKRERLPSQDDSPFALGGADAIDRTYVRKRKPFNPAEDAPQSRSLEDDADLDDAPPPPTSTLLDPSGYLAASADDEEATTTFPTRAVPAAAASYSSAGLFPSAGDTAWGSDGQYWITVFGYPTSARAFILSHFQTVGEVSNFISGAGNWLHLRYHTRLQAEQALALDGQTLGGGSAMIGVKKCYPSELDGVRQEPASSLYSSRARQNPGSSELEVDPTEADIMLPPRRRQDLCSRLLGYLFNW